MDKTQFIATRNHFYSVSWYRGIHDVSANVWSSYVCGQKLSRKTGTCALKKDNKLMLLFDENQPKTETLTLLSSVNEFVTLQSLSRTEFHEAKLTCWFFPILMNVIYKKQELTTFTQVIENENAKIVIQTFMFTNTFGRIELLLTDIASILYTAMEFHMTPHFVT